MAVKDNAKLIVFLSDISLPLAEWASDLDKAGATTPEILARLEAVMKVAEPAREGGYNVPSTHLFTVEEIIWIFCGEFEGNHMASWIHKANSLIWTRPKGFDMPWYCDPVFVAAPDFDFTINYDNPDAGDDRVTKTINRADIINGLSIMSKKYPEHFADLISESSADAVTYDVAMQCIVLGDIVYG